MSDDARDEINRCIRRTGSLIKSIKVTSPETSMNRRLSDSYMRMISCYFDDATHFMESGELVTAFAAVSYVYGWIDCGARIGLFDVDGGDGNFVSYRGELDTGAMTGVVTDTKIERYLDISRRAMDKIKPVSPDRSFNKRVTESFTGTINGFYGEAVGMRATGDNTRAFATVNYAHGWIDCGARIGLFDVGCDDQLFTLYD